jgi:hypothetical protein
VERTGVVALIAVGVGGLFPAPAAAEPAARSSQARLLETFTVLPRSTPPLPATTRTTLSQGASYSLVVTGTVTGTFTRSDGTTIGERQDAFYCYEETNEAAVDPTSSCTRNIRRIGALRLNVSGRPFVDQGLGLAPVAYRPTHQYTLRFRAPRSGRLSFISQPSVPTTGSFTIRLYGMPKCPAPCPRARSFDFRLSYHLPGALVRPIPPGGLTGQTNCSTGEPGVVSGHTEGQVRGGVLRFGRGNNDERVFANLPVQEPGTCIASSIRFEVLRATLQVRRLRPLVPKRTIRTVLLDVRISSGGTALWGCSVGTEGTSR